MRNIELTTKHKNWIILIAFIVIVMLLPVCQVHVEYTAYYQQTNEIIFTTENISTDIYEWRSFAFVAYHGFSWTEEYFSGHWNDIDAYGLKDSTTNLAPWLIITVGMIASVLSAKTIWIKTKHREILPYIKK